MWTILLLAMGLGPYQNPVLSPEGELFVATSSDQGILFVLDLETEEVLTNWELPNGRVERAIWACDATSIFILWNRGSQVGWVQWDWDGESADAPREVKLGAQSSYCIDEEQTAILKWENKTWTLGNSTSSNRFIQLAAFPSVSEPNLGPSLNWSAWQNKDTAFLYPVFSDGPEDLTEQSLDTTMIRWKGDRWALLSRFEGWTGTGQAVLAREVYFARKTLVWVDWYLFDPERGIQTKLVIPNNTDLTNPSSDKVSEYIWFLNDFTQKLEAIKASGTW